MKENKAKMIFFGTVAFLAFVARLLPHPANFVPLGALSIMAGAYLPRKYALVLPLLVMLSTDYFIGFYEPALMLTVYFSFLLYVLLGNVLGNQENKLSRKLGKLTLGAFLGALLFFLITNFAVWAFGSWYSKDLSGLLLSYTLALPFFKNTLAGDIFYTASLFLVYELIFRKILLSRSENLLVGKKLVQI